MKELLTSHSLDCIKDQDKEVVESRKKRLNVEVEYEVYRKLKLVCYNRDISISDFTRLLINDALKSKS